MISFRCFNETRFINGRTKRNENDATAALQMMSCRCKRQQIIIITQKQNKKRIQSDPNPTNVFWFSNRERFSFSSLLLERDGFIASKCVWLYAFNETLKKTKMSCVSVSPLCLYVPIISHVNSCNSFNAFQGFYFVFVLPSHNLVISRISAVPFMWNVSVHSC